MNDTETAAAAAGLAGRMADALGLPPLAVEMAAAALAAAALVVAVLVVLAIFRIRRELISLNFRLLHIGRLVELAVKKSAGATPAVSPANRQRPAAGAAGTTSADRGGEKPPAPKPPTAQESPPEAERVPEAPQTAEPKWKL